MKLQFIFVTIGIGIAMYSGFAFAGEANSSDYRVFNQIFDWGGQIVNSSSYISFASIPDTTGLTSGGNAFACLGYVCFALEPTLPVAVTFLLDFNITGKTNDVGFVDNRSTPGLYRPIELNKLFTCVHDAGITNTPTFGIIFSGNQLNYIEMKNQSNSYILRMSQFQEGNRFLLPATTGGCSSVAGKLPIPELTPFVSTGEVADAVELFLSYASTDLVGSYERSGKVSVILEKNDTNQIVVDVI